jgi:phosphoenolpyruvate-protein phosphotransferase (PTS system enzyme I)
MASEPLYVPILVALGLTELSMNAPCLPHVKRVLRQFPRPQALALWERLIQLPTAKEVARHLEREMSERFPDLFGRATI